MIILGIETSCDDTGIAIIKVSGKKRPVFNILSNIISSQIKIHQKYGGVVPNLAAREHLKNIEPCLRQAFQKTNLKLSNIDLIAVTMGPGLIPSLLVGVHFAKALAYKLQKPIVGINHIEAHIIAALAATNPKSQIPASPAGRLNPKQLFPAIGLVVSGGHTQLILIKKIGDYKIIGETRDDAAGECFDKVAKLLGLSYPGGPAIAAEAAKITSTKHQISNKFKIQNSKFKIHLPRPMINHKNYDFSFSGLKTAVLYLVKNMGDTWYPENVGYQVSYIPALCVEVQQAIIDVLISKTIRAAREHKVKTIILAGGVAANDELRRQFKLKIENLKLKIEFLIPSKILCTDNAAMIAITGYFGAKRRPAVLRDSTSWNKIKANSNLRIG